MDEFDIPIYRAKSIRTGEYIEGFLKPSFLGNEECLWIQTKEWLDYAIDPSTLSINFKRLIDSNGKKIFVSMGVGHTKGADKLEVTDIYHDEKFIISVHVDEMDACFGYQEYTDWICYGKVEVMSIEE